VARRKDLLDAASRAALHLSGADRAMAELVERHGPPLMAPRTAGRAGSARRFAALTQAVVYQQLAGTAASAIHRRFIEGLGGSVTPESVLQGGAEGLRRAGLSAAKTTTIVELAAAVSGGEIDLGRVSRLTDSEVVASLVRVRGIGTWTAQMFCIFELGRPDVWPVTDFGVRKGYARAYGLTDLPRPRDLEEPGERFRPHRSAAAWYLWRSAEEAPD
jgi:DNA-3-methyladenine glycosylase II